MIADAATGPGAVGAWREDVPVAERIILEANSHNADQNILTPVETNESESLDAVVNYGRWIVQCPCMNAQMASDQDPRFFCIECKNAFAGGLWVNVNFPPNKTEIETALDLRPDDANKNWEPGETLVDLEQENVDHEVES